MNYAIRDAAGNWTELDGAFQAEVADDDGEIDTISFPANWPALATAEERQRVGVAEVVETPQPQNALVIGSRIDVVAGLPTRHWLTEPFPVPQLVTPRQLRLALLGAGMLDQINAFVASAAVPPQARISWEYATEYRRDDAMLNAMAQILQPPMSAEQIDQLFIAAAAIQ